MLYEKGKKIYSFGEKINYYNSIINNKKSTYSEKVYAKKRINDLNSKFSNFQLGDVVSVDDKEFGNSISKPRCAVIVENNSINDFTLIAARKTGKFMKLENFDGDRLLNMDKSKLVQKNNFYELGDFSIGANAFLNINEKPILQQKYMISKMKKTKK